MSEDRSLEEFAGADGTDGDAGEAGDAGEDVPDGDSDTGDGDPPTDDDQPSTDDAPEPATSTSTVSPSGAPCEGCGAVVERRWLDAGGYVCSDCKDW